jgi:hypothetical protein
MSFLSRVKIVAGIVDWRGRWIHYSKTPYMKINPKQFHGDPMGIYFFPEKFKTKTAMWRNFDYKFVVELSSDAKILDLDKTSREQMLKVVKHCFGYIDREITEEDIDQINERKDYQDYAWEIMRNSKFMTQQAKWTKALTDLGYDGVFDDTRSIHTAEVQLIVLNQKKIKVLDMVRKSGTRFKDLEKVTNEVAEMFKDYGTVKVDKPKSKKGMWSDEKELSSRIEIVKDKREVSLTLMVNDKREEIAVSLSYARPSLSYGTGFSYKYETKEYEDLDRFKTVMDKIFHGPDEHEVGRG